MGLLAICYRTFTFRPMKSIIMRTHGVGHIIHLRKDTLLTVDILQNIFMIFFSNMLQNLRISGIICTYMKQIMG